MTMLKKIPYRTGTFPSRGYISSSVVAPVSLVLINGWEVVHHWLRLLVTLPNSIRSSRHRLTLAVHVLARLAVGRVWLVVGIHVAGSTIFRQRRLANSRGRRRVLVLVSYGRQLNLSGAGVAWCRRAVVTGFLASIRGSLAALTFLVSLAQRVFLLLASLPLFADFFEFCQVLASCPFSFYVSSLLRLFGGWGSHALAACRVAALA